MIAQRRRDWQGSGRPRHGPLWAVTSVRTSNGRREKVSRLFRQRPAAERYAARQHGLGRAPVKLWLADIPEWCEAP